MLLIGLYFSHHGNLQSNSGPDVFDVDLCDKGNGQKPAAIAKDGYNGRPWVHAVMCDNTYSDICMIIHASTL